MLTRLANLLRAIKPGYDLKEETREQPRGRIRWQQYATRMLPAGRWHQFPCRFPDLGRDPRLRAAVRWTLERVRHDLEVAGTDRLAMAMAAFAAKLLELLSDVQPRMPGPDELRRHARATGLPDSALQQGIEAVAWVAEERGLGGGRQLDGLAWRLSLDQLWERYVEAVYRQEASLVGAQVRVGRLGETTIPLMWSDSVHRSLGHLVPDLVLQRGREVQVVDAKYKAHLAELDTAGWYAFAKETQEAHRADVHQVLAYAALHDAEEVTASLVYPLRRSTWEALRDRGMDRSVAKVYHGGRSVTLELRGMPIGGAE